MFMGLGSSSPCCEAEGDDRIGLRGWEPLVGKPQLPNEGAFIPTSPHTHTYFAETNSY